MTVRPINNLVGIILALGLPGLALPAHASGDFIARNKHRVVATTVDGALMEVFSTPGAGAPGYFCAAANYAIRRLGANWSDRVVVVRPEERSASRPAFRSVLFAVRPWQEARSGNASFLMDVDRVGAEYTITLSLKRCELSRFW